MKNLPINERVDILERRFALLREEVGERYTRMDSLLRGAYRGVDRSPLPSLTQEVDLLKSYLGLKVEHVAAKFSLAKVTKAKKVAEK